jgi:type I restriction enzyme M protein
MFYNTGIGTYIWIVTNRKEKRRKGKIQLLDAREMYEDGGAEDNRRSLGDKSRHISAAQISDIVKLYGNFKDGETAKTFDNADFGFTRVTIERPLRLCYQMTLDDKARFLDACPHLLDDVQAIDKALGRKPQLDWNTVWSQIEDLLHARKSRWKAAEQKLFRNVFTKKDPDGERVLKTFRSKKTSTPTSPAKLSRTFPMSGWIAPRTKSAMKLTSTATSTATRHRVI